MPVIEVKGLSKKFKTKVKKPGLAGSFRALMKPEYREIEAVRDIDLTVQPGEILAFIGPNGAGKSTTIKMLTGILYPTAGEITVLGLNPGHDRQRLAYRIGTVFGQKSQLWFHLPPLDSFRLLAGIFEIPRSEFQNRLSYLIEIFELEDLLAVPVRKLSLGQRVRCEIAASLLHRPKIIFLDEPTIGLDVVVKKKIRDLILYLNQEEQTTIFLTSHDAGDIEKLCQRAIIINHGTIVLSESVKNLKHHYLNKKLIDVKFNEPVVIDMPGIVKLKDTRGDHQTPSLPSGYAAKIEVDTQKQNLRQVVAEVCSLGEVADINISDLPLEEIIAAIYTQSKEKNHE